MDKNIALELEKIRKDHDGILYPESVVAVAEDRNSPLHKCFTWDDKKAGHLYRIWQARCLIRIAVKVLPAQKEPINVYVSLTTDRVKGGGYRAVEEVLTSEELLQTMLADAFRELRRFRLKYERLSALRPVFDAVDKVEKKQLALRPHGGGAEASA